MWVETLGVDSYAKHRRMDMFSHGVETLGVDSYAKHRRIDVVCHSVGCGTLLAVFACRYKILPVVTFSGKLAIRAAEKLRNHTATNAE